MFLPRSTVGRKILMALTGQFMIIYVLSHVLGNSTIYFGAINAYAEGLRHWPYVLVLWSSRTLLFVSVMLHAIYGTLITLENNKAKPDAYAVTQYREASLAGRSMIWTGVIIGAFLVYHLLHFTFQITDPELSAVRHPDSLGRPDVFMMVSGSFRHLAVAIIYVTGVSSLGLHLLHGIQSSFQTWGMNNERTLPLVEKTGTIASILVFLGYAAIPISIVVGILKG